MGSMDLFFCRFCFKVCQTAKEHTLHEHFLHGVESCIGALINVPTNENTYISPFRVPFSNKFSPSTHEFQEFSHVRPMFKVVHTPDGIMVFPFNPTRMDCSQLPVITSNDTQNLYQRTDTIFTTHFQSWDSRFSHTPLLTPPSHRTSFPPGTIAYTPSEDLYYGRLYQTTPEYFGRVSSPRITSPNEEMRNILALSQLPDDMCRAMLLKVNDNTNVLRRHDVHFNANSRLIPSDVGHLSSKNFDTSLWSEQNDNGMDPRGEAEKEFHDVDPTLG
jgi:hypothetical protein